MPEDERVSIVHRLLREHLQSPSLRHIKDPYIVSTLAHTIVRKLDRGNSSWLKWTAPREQLVKAAVPCWIPTEDLRDHLNRMEGPVLSLSDVAQRLRAFEEETYTDYAREAFKPGCLAVYAAEKAQGTEMPAIVGVLRDHIEREDERLRLEQKAAYEARRESERFAAEQRLLSGADCKWTPWRQSKTLFCRVNARLYRLAPAADKRLELYRVDTPEDGGGRLLGRYLGRGDATKAVQQIAYQSEPTR
jgi:hypothetical protein